MSTKHADDCGWHVDQYPWECTCGAIPRKAIMDELIADSAEEITDIDPRILLKMEIDVPASNIPDLYSQPLTQERLVECLKYAAFKMCGKGLQEDYASDAMSAAVEFFAMNDWALPHTQRYWHETGKEEERKAIVKWLRSNAAYEMVDFEIADAIEAGEHLK